MENVRFEDMPSVLGEIRKELSNLKTILLNKEKLPKEYPKYLSIDEAVECLSEQGYKIPKGTLYKLTSSRKIPHEKFLGRLVFERREILTWCENQINSF